MNEVKQLIARFLESCGLVPRDYIYMPMGINEFHVRPFAPLTDEELEKIIRSGAEFGFTIKTREIDPRTDLKELVFIVNEDDLLKIKTAMQSIALTAGEFATVNE